MVLTTCRNPSRDEIRSCQTKGITVGEVGHLLSTEVCLMAFDRDVEQTANCIPYGLGKLREDAYRVSPSRHGICGRYFGLPRRRNDTVTLSRAFVPHDVWPRKTKGIRNRPLKKSSVSGGKSASVFAAYCKKRVTQVARPSVNGNGPC